MMAGHFTPCWDMQQIKDLNFKFDYHKDIDLIQKYADLGHSLKHMVLYNYFEPDPMPDAAKEIKKHFACLKQSSIAVNKFLPGQYLPMHHDLYEKFKSFHKVAQSTDVMRIIIMMEDSEPGQILQIEDTTWSQWQAGDWMSWVNTAQHAFYNFSMVTRYAWQLTGTL